MQNHPNDSELYGVCMSTTVHLISMEASNIVKARRLALGLGALSKYDEKQNDEFMWFGQTTTQSVNWMVQKKFTSFRRNQRQKAQTPMRSPTNCRHVERASKRTLEWMHICLSTESKQKLLNHAILATSFASCTHAHTPKRPSLCRREREYDCLFQWNVLAIIVKVCSRINKCKTENRIASYTK